MTTRLIVIGPLPRPYHGVTVSTGLVLRNPALNRRFSVEHLDTSDHRGHGNVGRWDLWNALLALLSVLRLGARLRGPPGIVYLPLSQGTPALVRDALFVHVASWRGWRVAAHLRGGEFDAVYRRQNLAMRRLLRSALSRLDGVAVLGECLRGLFDGLLDPERIAVVPNGTPAVSRNGVDRDHATGLFLSNLRRRKGVVQALDAALIVVNEHPSARFRFIGEWEDLDLERELRERARTSEGRIEFLPVATGEVQRRALASAGLLVFPPVEPEGHPRVVLEALAAGLPVVTTARGAIGETVVDGESGFVLEDPIPEEIAERILCLLRDRRLHEQMSEAARARYLSRFTQEEADRSLAEWLHHLAEA